MARRTPFHAFLTKIASEGKSCPSGSTMVAGKCVSNEASTSRTLSTTTKSSTRISVPTKVETPSTTIKISPTGGISASSISSTPTTFQKAVSTPTIAIQKPETVVLGGISISPASGVTTSIKRTVAVHEEQPVTRTPVAITEKKPITLATVKSVSSIPASEIPSASPTGESPGYIFRGIPIKM